MYKLTLEIPDQLLTATSEEGTDYNLTIQDTLSGRTFNCPSIEAAEVSNLIATAISGMDDGPMYDAANGMLNKLGVPRECWPIP